MKKTLIILFVILSNVSFANSIWQREIINYDRIQYKAGFQNWMITQSDNGWIYSANTAGLLEFDGVTWSLYRMAGNMTRSVAAIGNRVYTGGSSEFGYFEPNAIGELTYTSLSKNIPSPGGEVWNILQLRDNVYFVSDNKVHIYNCVTGDITWIDSDEKINSSTVFGNKIMLGTANGIAYLTEQKALKYVEDTYNLAAYKIVQLLIYNSKLLVVTARGGVYILENDRLERIKLKAESFIRNNQVFSAILSGSQLIIGSVQNGVCIVDLENDSYSEYFNIQNGIINNTILNAFIDKERNLWLALDKGISYINLNSPIRPLYATISPIGTGHCSAMYNGRMYFGTNQGVYTFNDQQKSVLLAGTEGQIWSMNVINNELFCAGDNNITVVTPTEHYRLNVNSAWEVHKLQQDDNKLIVGTYGGFSVLKRRNNRWVYSHSMANMYTSMRGFIEDDEPNQFWHIKYDTQVTKTAIDSTLTIILKEKSYNIKGELLPNNKYFNRIDNKITIATDSGLYYYSRLTDEFYEYTQLESMLDGDVAYRHLSIDNWGSIWYSTDRTIKMLPYKNGSFAKQGVVIGSIIDQMTDNYQNVSRIDSADIVFATDNGFSKINLSKKDKTHVLPMHTYIRRLLSSKQDSVISYGNVSTPIEIPFSHNSIKIEYSVPNYATDMDIKYIFRLKGKDEEWNFPTSSTSKEYTHLFEGCYEFEVIAIDQIDGKYSEAASLVFTILPPWYRTLYAYLIYFLFLCIFALVIYRLTFEKQKKIINQQKQENEIKDQEIYELQNKNLKDELHYKTQELSGYILNIIRKNDILEEVKKRAIGVSKALDEEDPRPIIKQKVTRLISQIDTNIEKDKEFEIFKSNFDIVHQDFFKQLDDKLPELTRNDKILCAYLNMNLSSKEIAPLLNISIRGVEVSRYRLRKKIGLERDENLNEYLQKLNTKE